MMPPNGEFPLTIEVEVVSVKDGAVTPIAKTTHKNWDCATDAAFSPDGAQVAYMDGECKAWLAKADGSGQPEAQPEFPYDWQNNTYPQWEGKTQAASPAAEAYYDGFDNAALDPAHWQPNSAILVKEGRVLFISKAADRAGAWDGSLEAVLPAPVKRIETMIGLESASGGHVGFGLDFRDDESGQPKSVWLNVAGSVLLDEGQGEFHEIMPPKSTPVEYNLLVEWLDTSEAAVWIDDQEIARLQVHDFAHRVVFWGHLETGD
jgi:hypothetical protein